MPISFVAAFLGGFLSLLSPCSVLVLPTFAAAATHKTHRLLVTTLIFSAGLLVSLIPLALGVAALSQVMLFYRKPITLIIGITLLIFGLMTIFGQYLPLPDVSKWILKKNKLAGSSVIFLLGTIAGLGATACVGPILGAIMSLAAASSHTLQAIGLILAFAMGIIFPLLLFTLIFEKTGINKLGRLSHHSFSIGSSTIPIYNLFAGLLLISIALIFLLYQGSFGTIPLISKTGILQRSFDLQYTLYEF